MPVTFLPHNIGFIIMGMSTRAHYPRSRSISEYRGYTWVIDVFFFLFSLVSLSFIFIEIKGARDRHLEDRELAQSPHLLATIFVSYGKKMTTLRTHQAITAISFIENNNTVVNTILCHVQPSNKRRPRIYRRRTWGVKIYQYKRRGAYSSKYGTGKKSGVSGLAFAMYLCETKNST